MQTQPTIDRFDEFKKLLRSILSSWYIVLITFVVFMAAAYLKNRYTTPNYVIGTTVLIKEAKDISNSTTEMLFGDELFKINRKVQNEGILIKRIPLIKQTLEKLNFSLSYYNEGNLITSELYKSSPVKVILDSTSAYSPYNIMMYCKIIGNESFQLYSKDEVYKKLIPHKTFRFNQKININGFIFKVAKTKDKNLTGTEIAFKLNDLDQLADLYHNRLTANPVLEKSSIISISIVAVDIQKEIDFLNTLVETYIENGLNEKNSNATQTLAFINEQLDLISDTLKIIENQLEFFKTKNINVDLNSANNAQLLEKIDKLESQKAGLTITDQYFSYLEEYLIRGENLERIIVPSSYDITDPLLIKSIDNLVSLQLEIKLIKGKNNIQNPLLKVKMQKVEELKSNILENLANLKAGNNIALRDINTRINLALNSLKSLPGIERKYINIQRNYNLNEKIYLFLLEKRLDAGIAKASNTPDFKQVNQARLVSSPTSQVKKRIYMIAAFLGLLLPVVFIYLKELLSNRILTKEEIVNYTDIPFLGVIGHGKNLDGVISKNSRSIITEAFRTIRTNLNYLIDAEKPCTTFLVTSSISNEGKTFCTTNLAYIFAISGQKTLLISTDMRKPNNYAEIQVPKREGLSNFLAGMTTQDSIVQKTNVENLDIVTSGDVPPNPSELILSKKMGALINSLQKEYKYIFLDTPPIGLLADGLELTKYADTTIFVVRQNFTQKTYISRINDIHKRKQIKNLTILFNDVNFKKYAYGYGYGYGYYAEDKKKRRKWSLKR